MTVKACPECRSLAFKLLAEVDNTQDFNTSTGITVCCCQCHRQFHVMMEEGRTYLNYKK
jgi:bacterioferritin-associated ferredoxin